MNNPSINSGPAGTNDAPVGRYYFVANYAGGLTSTGRANYNAYFGTGQGL